MGWEIERKFLVKDPEAALVGTGVPFCQGYLSLDRDRIVRVRMAGDKAVLSVKGHSPDRDPRVRREIECALPMEVARELLQDMCVRPLIEKVRHYVTYAGRVWEVDRFLGENEGLVVAEVELEHPDQTIELPPWVGEEVTTDPRYSNASLVKCPFSRWKEAAGSNEQCPGLGSNQEPID